MPKMVRSDNNLAVLNPTLAAEWNANKNQPLTPEDVTKCSGKKVWWQCDKGHEWQARIANRSHGNGCPYCAGKKVGSDNNLAVLNPTLAAEWNANKNQPLTPEDVTKGSGKKVWWQCDKGHEWQAAIFTRNKGFGCPYCAGKKVGSDNNLAVLNPTLAAEWHVYKNHPLMPEHVRPYSHKNVWWQCDKVHEWRATIASRSNGNGCPYCSGN